MKKAWLTILKIAVFFFGWILITGLVNIPSDNPALWRLGAEAVPLAGVVILSVVFWCIEKKDIRIFPNEKPIKNLLIGAAAGCLWLAASVVIICLLGGVAFTGKNDVYGLGIWIAAALLNVVMQELLVRGYICQFLKKEYNPAVAIIVSTAMFTLFHGGAFEAGVIPVLNVITMSLMMTLALEASHSLVVPIIMHGIWNAVGAVILNCVYLADDYPHLYNAVFSGSPLIAGFGCGIEGSVAVLIVNIALCILFSSWRKRERKLP